MNPGVRHTFLIVSMILAAATTSGADPQWTRVAPTGAGFSVETPGEPQPNQEPGSYGFIHGRWFMGVKVDPVEPMLRDLVVNRNLKEVKTFLEAMRDIMLASMKGTGGRSSSGEIDGYPYLRFSMETEDCDAITQIVVTTERMYVVAVAGPKGARDDDAKRFLRSFRLTDDAAGRIASPLQ